MTLLADTTSVVLPYDDALAVYDPTLGLEVHVELSTASKMFCGCSTVFGASPNTQVCPTCLGLPGALPVVNAAAVESAIRIGLALNCSIAPWSRFARKNYFYPDMPKNFQTSQYDEPLCVDGWLEVTLPDELPGANGQRTVRVEIERVHMEEDTGKSLHRGGSTGRIHGADYSLVDYNRAGIPLVEIVTRPVGDTGVLAPEVARAYVAQLRDLLRSLGVSDVRMEQGSLRCDANVSLAPRGAQVLGTRTETKNVNSLRSVARAIRYEIGRQAAVLSAGGSVRQETRHFQEDSGTTTPGRSKEQAEDYRYFPEPDLLPVAPDEAWIEKLRSELPELPADRRMRLMAAWSLSELEFAAVVNAGVVELIAATIAAGADAIEARKWWLGELTRTANERGVEAIELPVTPGQVARIVEVIAAGELTDSLARQVLVGVMAGEGDPDAVITARNLRVVSDDGALGSAIDTAIAASPEVAAKIRDGKVAAIGALVGSVMRATAGKADAARVRELLLERLTTTDQG
jgi:aspartyl-tRNA(Asn)/glutamyl-tRNA(Gln) amidotransferase subunit B